MNKSFYTTLFTLMYVLFSHSFSHTMNSDNNNNLTDNFFDQLSSDPTFMILTQPQSPYPWKSLAQACALKLVCKNWNNILSDKNKIRKALHIPKMHYAAMTDDIDQIIDLKIQGHSILAPDKYGFNPSHYAIAYNKKESIKMLQIGSNLIYFTEDHPHYKVKNDSAKKFLKTYYPYLKPHAEKEKEFITALQKNDFTHVKIILLAHRYLPFSLLENMDLTQNNQTTKLVLYCLQNFLEHMVHYDVNDESGNAAALRKQDNLGDTFSDFFIESFIASGANPNDYDEEGATPLHYLCNIGKKDLYDMLVQLLALPTMNINTPSKTFLKSVPLHIAAETGYLKALNALLQTGQCNVHIAIKEGLTALCYSVQNGHHECVNALIKHGADTTIIIPTNKNLLHIAAIMGHAKILDILIPLLKQFIEHKDSAGRTPLVSCAANNPDNANLCIQALIDAGANKEARTNNGQVALHYAAGWNHLEVAKVLLKNGANVNAQINNDKPIDGINYNGYTPLDLAKKRGHSDIIDILLYYGAH